MKTTASSTDMIMLSNPVNEKEPFSTGSSFCELSLSTELSLSFSPPLSVFETGSSTIVWS